MKDKNWCKKCCGVYVYDNLDTFNTEFLRDLYRKIKQELNRR